MMDLHSGMHVLLVIALAHGDPETAPSVPVQHHGLHIQNVARGVTDIQEAAGNGRGHHSEHDGTMNQESTVNARVNKEFYGPMSSEDVDSPREDMSGHILNLGNSLPQKEPASSKRHLGAAKNMHRRPWIYDRQTERDKRSVSVPLLSLGIDQQYGFDNFMDPPAIRESYDTNWGAPQENKRGFFSRFTFKRRSSPRRRNPVMHRWQSIWGSPGKRDSFNDVIQKQPIAIGPSVDWHAFLQKRSPGGFDDSEVNSKERVMKRFLGPALNVRYRHYDSPFKNPNDIN